MAGAFLILTVLGAGAWLVLQRKAADGVTVRGVDGVQEQVGAGQAADFARRQNCLMACQSDDRYCRSMALEPPALETCVTQDADCQAKCGQVSP
jgi:hypothetical protein